MAIISRNVVTREVWPNFFIVGAMKGGTTSLYFYLRDVPGIYMSPNKEPNYFASEDIAEGSKIVIRDKKKYLSLFTNVKNESAIGEASTTYLYSSHAPSRIYQAVPEAKIIMILRDPVQRAFSQYLSNVKYKNLGLHKMSFFEALEQDYNRKQKGIGVSILYIERGLYYEQVKRYIDTFGRKQVRVLIFEEYVKNTDEKVQEVLEFLGINAPPSNVSEAYNKFFIPRNQLSHSLIASNNLAKLANIMPETKLKKFFRKSLLGGSIPKPEISRQARTFLRDIFANDVKKLESLLGLILPWEL